VVVTATRECQATYGIILRTQTVSLARQQLVCIVVRNPAADRVIVLPQRCVLGRAVRQNLGDQAAESPGYRLQFLRHYFTTRGKRDIQLLEERVCFGPEAEVKFHKNLRTNFR
jgi:hypothetical protein